jgi:deazaflavin-dependent oxidoreductase (nitroreductase family)
VSVPREMTRHDIRRRYLWVLNHTLNRITTRMAKSGRGPFSLIRHVGRKSGQAYETPVILARVSEGFVAELTYGENVNWYRNAVAAGGCIVLSRGEEYRVSSIEPWDATAGRAAYPASFRIVLELLGRTEFRLLRIDACPTTASAARTTASTANASDAADDEERGT